MFFRMVYKSGQIFLPFCHNTRVWRTDGQTEFSSQFHVCITCSAVKFEANVVLNMLYVSRLINSALLFLRFISGSKHPASYSFGVELYCHLIFCVQSAGRARHSLVRYSRWSVPAARLPVSRLRHRNYSWSEESLSVLIPVSFHSTSLVSVLYWAFMITALRQLTLIRMGSEWAQKSTHIFVFQGSYVTDVRCKLSVQL